MKTLIGRMRSFFAVFSLGILVQARRVPPGAPADHSPWIPPGKTIECQKWFPQDPCFYQETYQTQCYRAYDWEHMRYPKRRAVLPDYNPEDTVGWANITSIESGIVELSWSRDWSMSNLDAGNQDTSTKLTQDDVESRAQNKALQPRSAPANPPCCQWTQACYDLVTSKPSGYAFDGDNEEQEYYKFVCCLTSWAMKCGGHVPRRPQTIRAPPECTMPWGHEQANA